MAKKSFPDTPAISPLFHAASRIRLASSSPRRLELLQQMGITPEVRAPAVEEVRRKGEKVSQMLARLAQDKVRAALSGGADFVIGADTVVCRKGEIFGKPSSPEEAARILRRLSGKQHQVMTGVAVGRVRDEVVLTRVVETRVWIKAMTAEEIAAYVATGEPLDKAGAYGIQGKGAFLVAHIEGSYSNVVGLPLFETIEMLNAL